MPSFNIHLAIANRYMEKHKIENKEDFLTGNIAPDFAEKAKSHYSIILENATLSEEVKNKVIIENFLKQNEIKTDYDKGVFLHLLADKIFFTSFFDDEYLQTVDKDVFKKNLYYSYGKTNAYLTEKYNIKFPKKYEKEIEEITKCNITDETREKVCILPFDKLDKFIEEVSNINLDEYAENCKNTSC